MGDRQYISFKKQRIVVNFEMNKVCAAGTGSFLEEQSERFDMIGRESFCSPGP
ncbi:MAG: hypothetical protein U5N58_03355 [Actinomycetota bacterium]|nr:hypothetical protein [Actinomycetota bacterium]